MISHPRLRRLSRLVLPCVVVLATAAVAAASEGGGAHEEMPSLLSMSMLWRVFNFAILAGILYKFVAKPLGVFLKGRREEIITSLEEAKRAKEAAESRYRELSERLANRDQEFAEIRKTASENAEKMQERMIAETRAKAIALEKKAKASIEQELKQAREDLKRQAADLAVKLAEDKLTREITVEDHRRFMDEYLAGLK
ncbi:MAG: F0F1 ATP synthase subunit B [bacterium]|nr:F0F1 ATP synthase subunit B [bacterium]